MRRPARHPAQPPQRTRNVSNGVYDSEGRGTRKPALTQVSLGGQRWNMIGDTLVDEWGKPLDMNTVPLGVIEELRKLHDDR